MVIQHQLPSQRMQNNLQGKFIAVEELQIIVGDSRDVIFVYTA